MPENLFFPAFFYWQYLKRDIISPLLIISHWWLASLLICLLFCSVQCVSSLPLLAFIAARSHRSRTDYAVCDNLPALPRFAVLSSPLAHLHVTRHAQEFAFVMLCQRVGLSAKRQDRYT